MAYQPHPPYQYNQQYNPSPQYLPYAQPTAYPQVQVVVPSPSAKQHQFANQVAFQSQRQNVAPVDYSHVGTPFAEGPPHHQYQPNHHTRPPPHPAPVLPYQSPPMSVKQNGKAKEVVPAKEASAPARPPLDYQVLLLSLAEEYLAAAHGQGTLIALAQREMEMEQYYKLVATGLGCLEAVLKNWRLQPQTEAMIRLRYARVLYEETDNDLEAETALSKGVSEHASRISDERLNVKQIDLCERNRLTDLKYSLQQLLARVLYKSNPKAAMKSLDGMIEEVEAYQHVAWEYAFRFLRVSLSLSSSLHQDFIAAVHNLQKISTLANRSGDKAVLALCAIVEALAHLQSSSADSVEQAQRALASARSHQLDSQIQGLPQINVLLHIIDLSCSLQDLDVNQAAKKKQSMTKTMDDIVKDPRWQDDGSFSILLTSDTATRFPASTSGIIDYEHGQGMLTLSWLPKHDVYALGYLLSAVTIASKNATDGHKAEKYLQEGLRMTRSSLKNPLTISEPISSADIRCRWRRTLHCHILLQLTFLVAARTEWELASKTLAELQRAAAELGDHRSKTLRALIEYLQGVIYQGSGNLEAAVSIYQSQTFELPKTTSRSARNDPLRDVCILAALNTIFILRDPSHPQHELSDTLLASVEPFCQSTHSKYISAAYYLIKAIITTDSTIKTKKHLQQALQAANSIGNSQINAITLSFMSWKYFNGVVGDQATKSAKAGRAQAGKAGNRLWMSVTDDMLADTFDKQGKSVEANRAKEDALRLASELPEGVKRYGLSGAQA